MGLIGAAPLAAHAIALQIASMSFMIPLGLNQAATVRVGLAYGAGDPEGISRSGWTAYVIGVSFMALMALVMVSFAASADQRLHRRERSEKCAG